MTQSSVVVLGIGNRLMCDDGIGIRVAEQLGRENAGGNIRYIVGETDIDYSLDEIANAEICVIIDAAYAGGEPCSVSVQDLEEVLKKSEPARTFHEYDLIRAMKREGMARKGLLITIEAASIGFSEELSLPMKDRFDKIVQQVKALLPI